MKRYVYEVARNHARIINHTNLINQKLDLSKRIVSDCNNFNYTFLPKTSKLEKEISFINNFSHTTYNVGLLEFHPTDQCNLRCVKCSYDRNPDTFPIKKLRKVLQLFQPKGIVLVGGGEPTLYHDVESGCSFNELVLEIKSILPKIQIGLITNGTNIPTGTWMDHINWMRISVDAAQAVTYQKLKGIDTFETVKYNVSRYLESNIPHVGLGFLCTKLNIDDVPAFILMLSQLADNNGKEKLNIQFRHFRKRAFGKNSNADPQDISCSSTQLQEAQNAITKMRKNQKMAYFLDQHSNWEKIFNPLLKIVTPQKCYRALSFALLRPNGDLYPCFIGIYHPEYILGNVLKDDFHNNYSNLLHRELFFYQRKGALCNNEACTLKLESEIFEKYPEVNPQLTDEAKNSPFF
jgi:radical SAM protein with 4Fe4S-binding SPASM domain